MTQIREYKDGDEEGILNLYKKVFKVERDIEYWKWLYLKKPATYPIIALAEEESKIVGQCTLLPTEIKIKGERILVGHSIDTMVDSDYRGKGLHRILTEKTYDIAKDKDIKIRIGFPNNAAITGLLGSIGATLTTGVPLYINIYKLDNFLTSVFKIRPLAKILSLPGIMLMKILYRDKKLKPEKNYEIKEIVEFNEEFNDLSDIVSQDNKMMSIRTSSFLNWRIKDHPHINYMTKAAYLDSKLMGYIIMKIEDRTLKANINSRLGSIVDVIAIDGDVATALNQEAKKYFKDQDVDFAAMWGADSFKYKDVFSQSGFHKSKSTIPFVVKDLTEDERFKDIIEKESEWYLMPIESDFY